MSKVSVPITIRRMRHKTKTYLGEVSAYEYLLSTLCRHVISEKYVLDKNMLVLDLKESNKRMIKMAVETIFQTRVTKVTSSVRKPYVKIFRGRKGFSSQYTRTYIRTSEPVDMKTLDFLKEGDNQ